MRSRTLVSRHPSLSLRVHPCPPTSSFCAPWPQMGVRSDQYGMGCTKSTGIEVWCSGWRWMPPLPRSRRIAQVLSLYVPGQAAFDGLLEHWGKKRFHRVVDLRKATEDSAEDIARAWCENYKGVTFISCQVRSRKSLVSGKVLVLVTAVNGIDQQQRLLEQSVVPEGHHAIPAAVIAKASVLLTNMSLGEIAPHAVDRVRRAVTADEDLNKFSHYYASRRIVELARAGKDQLLLRKAANDFTVSVKAEVVGFQGTCYEEVIIDVQFRVDKGMYTATLQAVPASRQVIEQPTAERCELTGLRMPYGVLARCERTSKLTPRHLLHTSEVSGRQAHRDFFRKCQMTGKLALDTEVAKSPVSDVVAVLAEFVECGWTHVLVLKSEVGTSDMSGTMVRKDLLRASVKPPHRLGIFPDEFDTCEQTGAELLKDELAQSDLSGKWVDRELLVQSELAPNRWGLLEETEACQETNRRLLRDEVRESAVSGRTVGLDRLVKSAASERWALPAEMRVCEETEAWLLPKEGAQCAVTHQWVDCRLLTTLTESGRQALTRLTAVCEQTGKTVLASELERCSLSNKMVLASELETCVCRIRTIRSRLERCSETDVWLCPQCVGVSAVSNRRVNRQLLAPSALPPGRLGLETEFVKCAATGQQLLIDEVAASDATDLLVGRHLLVESALPGRFALPSEMVTCAVSRVRLLPDEVAQCTVTHQLVDRRLLVQIGRPPTYVLRKLTGVCSRTKVRVLLRELETCQWSGARVLKKEAGRCDLTGMVVSQSYLNDDGQLAPLAALLTAQHKRLENRMYIGVGSSEKMLRVLRSLDLAFKDARNGWAVRSPTGRSLAVVLSVEVRGWFRRRTEFIGVIVQDGSPPRILGTGVQGLRDSEGNFKSHTTLEFD